MAQRAPAPRHGPPPPLVGSHLTPALRARLLAAAAAARSAAHANLESGTSGRGVYTGTAGLALADLWVARRLAATSAAGRAAAAEAGLPPAADLAASAAAAARSAARLPPGSWRPPGALTSTFLEGRLGPYVVAGGAAAAAAPSFGPGDAGFEEWVSALADAATTADACLQAGECEVLYGRAGVLAALVFAGGWVPGAAARLEPAARALATSILDAGRAAAAARRAETGEEWGLGPFSWHGSLYLGAAHGSAGILATLAEAARLFGRGGRGRWWAETVHPAVAAGVRGLCAHGLHPSGNLKSSTCSADDRLVHWCHGAPGLVPLLARAGGWPGAAAAAAAAEEVVWARGWLTRKGVGLCHGWAGNGYALLAGARAADLARPLAWAAAIADHWAEAWRRADRPASLYEGLAGSVCFLVDVALWEEGGGTVGMPGFLLDGG